MRGHGAGQGSQPCEPTHDMPDMAKASSSGTVSGAAPIGGVETGSRFPGRIAGLKRDHRERASYFEGSGVSHLIFGLTPT